MLDARTGRTVPSEARRRCDAGCASGRAGHGLLAIQERVAAASPGAWRDLVVVAVREDGLVELASLEDDGISVWHHADPGLVAGDPVALHPVAGVLAAGRRLLSALPV